MNCFIRIEYRYRIENKIPCHAAVYKKHFNDVYILTQKNCLGT